MLPFLGLPAWWGRSPLGVSFERAKETKTRLGRSPLKTPLGYQAVHASSLSSARDPCCGSWYCHHTRPPWAAGPTAWRFSCPGLPWSSGVPAAGGFCRTSCVAVVGAVACPARGCPGLALGDSGGASTQQPKKCGNVPGHFRPKAPLCKGSCQPLGRLRGCPLRWAPFLSDEKGGKESPKAGPSPALWNPPRGTGCPCVLLFSALGRVGSHGWHGSSTEYTCFCGNLYFYRRGLTRVSRCSQLSAAGTPLLRGEALEGEAPSYREGGASHRLARPSM